MKGRRIDLCSICHARGTGYRRVAYRFRETGYSEQSGMIVLVAMTRIYESGPICWRHNYQRAEDEPEQLSFLGGSDESLPRAGSV
jgi:hypothetical protein